MVGLKGPRGLQSLLLPPRRSEPEHMGLFRPFPFGAGSIQAVPPNILAAFGGNMLCELQEEPHHRKGLGLCLEELVVGGEGDHGGFAVLFDAYLFQG